MAEPKTREQVLAYGVDVPRQPEPAWWAGALNRRAAVEQWMFDAARGKRPMPTPEELRAWAIKLGTPEPGEPSGVLVDASVSSPFNKLNGNADGVAPSQASSTKGGE